jgi:hypothetical protein
MAPERTSLDPDETLLGAPVLPGPGRPGPVSGPGGTGPRPVGGWVEVAGWGSRPVELEPAPLPAPLGPMTIPDLLDGAWAILSGRPRTVLALSALTVVPAEIIASLLIRQQGRGVDVARTANRAVSFASLGPGVTPANLDVAALVALAVISLAYTVLGAALARLVVSWYEDTDLTVRQAIGPVARRLPVLVAAWAVVMLLQGLALAACVLPALFVMPLFLLVAPVIGIERAGPLAAIRRSGQLVKRRYASVVWIFIVSLVLERIIDALVTLPVDLLAALAPEPAAATLRAAGWAFAQFLTAPVVAGLTVMLYIDLRVRREGLDLLVEADDVFPERSRG